MTKATKIKQKLKETKEKRMLQTPKVFRLKLQNLSKTDLQTLERLFLEAMKREAQHQKCGEEVTYIF